MIVMKKLALFIVLILMGTGLKAQIFEGNDNNPFGDFFGNNNANQWKLWLQKGVYAMQNSDYDNAVKCFESAAKENPQSSDAYYLWGEALSQEAEQKKDLDLYKQSFTKFEHASQLKPEDSNIYNDWGCAIMNMTKIKHDLHAYKDKIESLFKKTESMSNQSGAYNLACLYSLLERKKEALDALERALTTKYDVKADFSRKQLAGDKDLDNIRKDPRFAKLVEDNVGVKGAIDM